MAKSSRPPSGGQPGLDQISTRWPQIKDPVQFVMRYAPAIQKYLEALLKNSHDAEELTQDFLLRGILHGFVRTSQLRGRFRDYLKTAVRNAALTYLQRRRRTRPGGARPEHLSDPAAPPSRADEDWLAEWRQCVLDRAWQALERHQSRSPGNLAHTVLRLATDHPDDDSATLAARAMALIGRPFRADAFRKQLSRARRLFAELLVAEVAHTLERPTPAEVELELVETGLMPYVLPYLPDDWHERDTLAPPQ
jgi:RNA polymerase sigma-70 factor (ECF subfamily)